MVNLAFNSRMMSVYELNDKDEIRNSKFVFDGVIHMDIGNNKRKEFGSRMFQMGCNCSYEMGRDR